MSTEPLLLVNCTACDDIYRANTDKPQRCVCGKSGFSVTGDGSIVPDGSRCRILGIAWEDYDSAAPGVQKSWTIVIDQSSAVGRSAR